MVGFLSLILLIGLVLVGARWAGEFWRRETDRLAPGVDPRRLERLESALGDVEARLDRLQDQQRFLERLLAERPKPGSLPPGGRGGGAGDPGGTGTGDTTGRESDPEATDGGILFDLDGERE